MYDRVKLVFGGHNQLPVMSQIRRQTSEECVVSHRMLINDLEHTYDSFQTF